MSGRQLVEICKEACDTISPLIRKFYAAISADKSNLQNIKKDESVFTIADGIVQNLLVDHLFRDKIGFIVGEEECRVNLTTKPYTVSTVGDNLEVPVEFQDDIDAIVREIALLRTTIHPSAYKDSTVFIDPIDGTREFANKKGEQCTVCIGFSDSRGQPFAGIVYRPITEPATWAAGCAREEFWHRENLDKSPPRQKPGLLTSNGTISPFLEQLMKNLEFERVPSGGAGNKMLMLLEGKGTAYIQDRGVSRWDTCGAQAVLEANGGTLSKLTSFISSGRLLSYTYLNSPHNVNLDFSPNEALLTPYNSHVFDKSNPRKACSVEEVNAYSNLCGLIALDGPTLSSSKEVILRALQKTALALPPLYD